MPRSALTKVLVGVVVVLLIAGGIVLFSASSGYKAQAMLPAGNPNIIEGAPILINGFHMGTVDTIEPKGDGALLTINVDSQAAPLHQGAAVSIQWDATVGQRLVQVNDGPQSAPEIPNGGMLQGNMPRPQELSDILGSLDPQTRAQLGPLAQNLNKALAGHEQDLNATLRTAGPAFTALGNVTRGLAIDEPSINKLVTDTNALLDRIDSRNQDLSGVVNDLSTSSARTAAVRDQLRATLQKLPTTLDTAQGTLAKVPAVTDQAVPLLNDAKSATDKLPAVSNNLAPLLVDLRPTIAELKPTLQAASTLLNTTPGLLDSANVTVPGLTRTVFGYTPTLATVQQNKEAAYNFASGWGSASRNSDANGNYVRILLQASLGSVDEFPLPLPTGEGMQGGGSGAQSYGLASSGLANSIPTPDLAGALGQGLTGGGLN